MNTVFRNSLSKFSLFSNMVGRISALNSNKFSSTTRTFTNLAGKTSNNSQYSTLTTTSITDNSLDTFFPYGRFDFRQIREANRFFADNSRYIRHLERAGEALLFFRPHRFGKSLFVSMLEHYYDEQSAKELFDGLDIGTSPTPLARSFHVLKLDFSISINNGIQANFTECVVDKLKDFRTKYELDFEILDHNCEVSLKSAARAVKRKGGKLYILIDEYDRFANELLVSRRKVYESFIIGTRGEELSSPMRSFLQTVKTVCGDDGNTRLFMTGIMPLALADASGFNIAENMTLDSDFSSMVGFRERDLAHALSFIEHLNAKQQQQALQLMKKYFNGYLFSGGDEPMYNPTLSLRLLKALAQRKANIDDLTRLDASDDRKTIVPLLQDDNVRLSNSFLKLARLAPNGEQLVADVERGSVPSSATDIMSQFTLEHLLQSMTTREARSLLYYQGIVTFSDRRFNSLTLPNEIIRDTVFASLLDGIQFRNLDLLVREPNEEVLTTLFGEIAKVDGINSEATFQSRVFSVLNLLGRMSRIKTEVRVGKTRADIVVESGDGAMLLLLELKVAIGERVLRSKTPELFGVEKGGVVTNETMLSALPGLDDTKLLTIRINPSWTGVPIKGEECKLGHLVVTAQRQAKQYVEQLRRTTNTSSHINAFAVVLVGNRVIVRQADQELADYQY